MRGPRSLRGKMLAMAGTMLAIIGGATLYTGFASAELVRSLGLLFNRNLRIENVRMALSGTASALASYLSSSSQEYYQAYARDSSRLAESARALNREILNDEGLLLQRELAGLVERYLVDAEAAIEARRFRYIVTYTGRFESSERSADLARSIIERIERRNLAASIEAYTGLNARIGAIIATNAALVVAAVLMAFTIFMRFSWTITGPLSTLAEAARGIARGEYHRVISRFEAAEEIATVATAFEQMRDSVEASFEEQRSKAEIERRLIEEELRLVDLDRRLKDTELLALQSQINPHFLFNTLAAGMQLALAEKAERTGDFMEKLALFIRYALRSPSRRVSVAEEIECVESFVWLLRLRFGERYSFSIDAEAAALPMETTALVLQPLVENAVTHGLRNREEGGRVSVRASESEGVVLLEVADNGAGMEADMVERILREGGKFEEPGEPGGIGLHNVIRRISLSTGGSGRVEIESAPGAGTAIRIRLPSREATK